MALAAVILVLSTAAGCSAEIPHENYDLVDSDLEMVVALLNASIRASEEALSQMISEDTEAADQSLALIDTALAPASALVEEMTGVADSYDDLSVLLPPFNDLQDGMREAVAQEADLLDARDRILALFGLQNMTDEQTEEALLAVAEFRSSIAVMEEAVDDMLASALRIDGLTLDDTEPFVPNALVELIEELRSFLSRLEQQVEDGIQGDIPWQEGTTFLLLWLADDDVFLGDGLAGGGYLYSDSGFVEGADVSIIIDGAAAVDLETGDGGTYSFSFTVPLDESWLGTHSVAADATLLTGTVSSETLMFNVTLIPTVTTVELAEAELSPLDTARAVVRVEDSNGAPLEGAGCTLWADGVGAYLVTGEDGSAEWSMAASALGFGPHDIYASYGGELPYAPSASGTSLISVTIPTSLNLTLFSDRLERGGYLLGTCELLSNDSAPMPGRTVTMLVDGIFIHNYTTDENGTFAFSHRAEGIGTGSHMLSVTYDGEGIEWRDASDWEVFTVIVLQKSKYPFFPWIPDWGTGFAEEIPDLFFGENAYYTWLLMLLVLGLAMRALSARRAKRAAQAAEEERRGAYEQMRVGNGRPEGALRPTPSAHGRSSEEPGRPHDSVIWHYGRLMDFLRRRRKVSFADSMTHWEVARLLLQVGYPRQATNRATALFERAFYSGSGVSDEDAAQMRASVGEIMDHTGGAGHAG